ncbi:MAG: CheR family methyltransferase [Polyangiales bacterium]
MVSVGDALSQAAAAMPPGGRMCLAQIEACLGLAAPRCGLSRRGLWRARLSMGQARQLWRWARHSEGMSVATLRLLWQAETLLNHESYFFRAPASLHGLAAALAAETAGAPARPWRLWSAGCATGEEAYTLAMIFGPAAVQRGCALTVLGTDCSPLCIWTAHTAAYRGSSLRALTAAQHTLFVRHRDHWQPRQRWRRHCTFRCHNLAASAQWPAPASLDAVVCRNVLMYLRPPVRSQVVERLIACLRPGGYLCVGAQEVWLVQSDAVRSERLDGGDFVFRRISRSADPMAPTRRLARSGTG